MPLLSLPGQCTPAFKNRRGWLVRCGFCLHCFCFFVRRVYEKFFCCHVSGFLRFSLRRLLIYTPYMFKLYYLFEVICAFCECCVKPFRELWYSVPPVRSGLQYLSAAATDKLLCGMHLIPSDIHTYHSCIAMAISASISTKWKHPRGPPSTFPISRFFMS